MVKSECDNGGDKYDYLMRSVGESCTNGVIASGVAGGRWSSDCEPYAETASSTFAWEMGSFMLKFRTSRRRFRLLA
jgi:hypothetical protein